MAQALRCAAGSGLIYVAKRAEADRLVYLLNDANIDAAAYHAGMEARERQCVQACLAHRDTSVSRQLLTSAAQCSSHVLGSETAALCVSLPSTTAAWWQAAFMAGDTRVVVATVAFGMGINKAGASNPPMLTARHFLPLRSC